jgi:predicted negative regulator of RcsB-dependent stress response
MKNIILTLLLSLSLFAKVDYIHSFIDSTRSQIDYNLKEDISRGYDSLKTARKLMFNGKIDDAFDIVKVLQTQNKIAVLDSGITLLYCEILLRKKSKRFIYEAEKVLEKAINSSVMHENDLIKSYTLLSDIKLNLNKPKEAKYYANILIQDFNSPMTNVYGQIALVKTYIKGREYNRAARELYKILTETDDMTVATLVAENLYDVYILDNKPQKARELMKKVLHRNIDFYANDSFKAIKMVDKLLKSKMPEYAAQILEEMIKRTTDHNNLEEFKYRLAEIYMSMYGKDKSNLQKAKDIFQEIFNDYPRGKFKAKAKEGLDEVLMREGKIEPSILANKYKTVLMKQKVLLQELINYKKDKQYEQILLTKPIYRKISKRVLNRFGFDSIEQLFSDIHVLLIEDYLDRNKCDKLTIALKGSDDLTIHKLTQEPKLKANFFGCLQSIPNKKTYLVAKKAFEKERMAEVYLELEKTAILLNNYEDALDFSKKIDMVNAGADIRSKEFLYRYVVYKRLNDEIGLKRFFIYADMNPSYIEADLENPLIIDFFYDYYLHLVESKKPSKAKEFLTKLYDKQHEVNAFVYSPFVELELSKNQKDIQNYKEAIKFLEEPFVNMRKILGKDKAKLHYELYKLYKELDNKDKVAEHLQKCKDLQNVNSFYKELCDKI